METLTQFVDGLVKELTDDLQHQMVDLGLTKVEAVIEVMRDSTLDSQILRMALEKLDTRLAKDANDKPYYVVYMTGSQLIVQSSPKDMIAHGYTVKENTIDCDLEVYVDSILTAKMFKEKATAVASVYSKYAAA